jgi:hypothetical protein
MQSQEITLLLLACGVISTIALGAVTVDVIHAIDGK